MLTFCLILSIANTIAIFAVYYAMQSVIKGMESDVMNKLEIIFERLKKKG